MKVSSIFKILIGTIVVMTVTMMSLEFFNVSMNSAQVSHLAKLSLRKACELFIQESYRNMESNSIENVVDSDGEIYIGNQFYDVDLGIPGAIEANYAAMYKSSKFKEWLGAGGSGGFADNWENTKYMRDWLYYGSDTLPLIGSGGIDIDKYTKLSIGKSMIDNMVTPANIGICYMDKDVLQKMFRWQTAMLLSNCNPERIRTDDNGDKYVYYSGFRIYASRAVISDIVYQVYDLANSDQKTEFAELSNLDVDALGLWTGLGTPTRTDRSTILVAEVHYQVEIGYEGVTPFRRLVESLWENEVEGTGKQDRTSTLGSDLSEELVTAEWGSGDTLVRDRVTYFVIR